MHPLRGALIALTALITTVSPLEAKADSHRVRGIDVSHHQGNIDWTAVSQDPQQIRFVIARASACRSTADTKYDANQSGASAAGLTTGAYHFACPDDDEGDARAEADFFVQRAALRSGDIVPALDLEGQSLTQSGDGLGCGTQALRDWVWTWLNRVRERTGLRAMIYTPPSFWRNCMGNDSSYADAGHDLLWIAHWCSPEGTNCPSVPADNWDGNGWTFWQYTSSGTVNGIAGNVDMNWHNGADIAPATIRTITVRASGGGSVEHELASCSTTCERFGQKGLTTQLIAVPDSNRVLQSWSGACSGANTTCDAVVESDVTVAATFTNPLPTARIPAPPALSGPIALSFSKSV
ncbi:MAG TPA: GH25 family lysozyme, partial [Actinomycetota bacterium]|nr:GH25 family lysozyme [Actinomycetota bacterium]